MSRVDLTVNGRSYLVQCDDGQEPHLRKLAASVDRKIKALVGGGAQVSEAHLLLLASLMIADELHEAAQPKPDSRNEADEEECGLLVETVEHLASRIEAIAARLDEH